MTLVEFIAPLRNSPHRDRILAVLYYKHRYENINALTVEQLRLFLKNSRAPGWSKANIPDILAKSGHLVDSPGIGGNKRLWNLTPSGIQYVQKILGLPPTVAEIEHDIGSLKSSLEQISDPEIKDYVDEALKCLQVGALRASVVFLWSGAIRLIQNKLLTLNLVKLNCAIKKFDPKARDVSKLDHFSYIKDSISILASVELGIFDKNQKDTLEESLNLRNRCGHPGKYKPGVKKVSSFIEDVTSIVFVL
jgi:hypothetical protein